MVFLVPSFSGRIWQLVRRFALVQHECDREANDKQEGQGKMDAGEALDMRLFFTHYGSLHLLHDACE